MILCEKVIGAEFGTENCEAVVVGGGVAPGGGGGGLVGGRVASDGGVGDD